MRRLARGLFAVAASLALAAAPGCGNDAGPSLPAAVPGPFDHGYAAWDGLLARHVQGGRVDYAGLAGERPAFDAVIAALATPAGAEEGAWTRAQRTAFWINAYNALTVGVVLDNQPLASIKDIGLVPYAAFRAPVARFRARPAPLSLQDIEERILLGELWGARVHVAINCASVSCPALLPRAWRADDLDATLDQAARAFLADATKNRWDATTRTLSLSKIFQWYAADFAKAAGGVEAWVARYAPPEMAAGLAAGGHTIVYLEYDWSLNGSAIAR